MNNKEKVEALIKKINAINDSWCADDDGLDDAILDAMDLADELDYPS